MDLKIPLKYSTYSIVLSIIEKNQLFHENKSSSSNILLVTNPEGKNEIIAPQEIILAQAAKPRGQELSS